MKKVSSDKIVNNTTHKQQKHSIKMYDAFLSYKVLYSTTDVLVVDKFLICNVLMSLWNASSTNLGV